MTSRNLKINIALILFLGLLLIISALSGSWLWLTFIIPAFIYSMAIMGAMHECENCGKPIGHEVKKESPIFVAITMPTLTCRHCGHKH